MGFVGSGDLDGDGDADVIGSGGDGIVWFENLGGGGFGAERSVAQGIDLSGFVHAADLDDDGVVGIGDLVTLLGNWS